MVARRPLVRIGADVRTLPPGDTIESGIGTTDHDQLSGVSPDDHHSQVHSITGADHSGFPGGTTTFLRADGTFAAPAGGGGGGAAWFTLPVGGGVNPDGTGTGNNPAAPEKVVSSGTQTTNTPKVSYDSLLFDQSTDEHWIWNFQLPDNYGSGGDLHLLWGAKVTSGNVIWKAGAEIVDTNSGDTDAAVYNAADLSSATAVPATVGLYKETVISLTMTGASASEWISVFVGRDADNGSDTAAGDAVLIGLSFEYTSA